MGVHVITTGLIFRQARVWIRHKGKLGFVVPPLGGWTWLPRSSA
jgi:hypothetical protein